MKIRKFLQILAVSAALAFSGCQSFVVNMTPPKFEANASDIYTFRVKINENLRNIVPNTLKVSIVINGETHAMRRDTESGRYVWIYEYPISSNVSEVPYYFVAEFTVTSDGYQEKEIVYSSDFTPEKKPYTSIISNRYVIKIASSRSPAGAMIGVLGQGFTEMDKVIVGDMEAETTLISHSHINFVVPELPAGRSYDVRLRTAEGDLSAGSLYIDPSTIGVQPNVLNLNIGDSVPVTFFVDNPAPAGGMIINLTAPIPGCLDSTVVTIPEGERSASVTARGSEAGKGFIYISAQGFEKVKVPIEIK